MKNELIKTLKDMWNGDASSDIQAFNDFVEDFIDYMNNAYDMSADEVRDECGLEWMIGRGSPDVIERRIKA